MRTAYDDKSIMRYSLPLSFVKKEYQGQCPALATSSFCVMPNFELSFLDTDGICRLYPYEIGGTESASIGTRRHYYLNAGGGDGLAGGGPEGGVKVVNHHHPDPEVSDEIWWIQ